MKQIIIAALVGGIVVFIVSAAIHMSPLGMVGLSSLPNEDAVLQALRENVPNSGLYFFPGERSDTKEWEAKMKQGPSGLLVYTAGGALMMDPKQLIAELVTDIVAAFIAACILALIAASYGTRVMITGLLGVFGWVSLLLSYWIWYRFPTSFILMEGVGEIVCWLIAGLVIAKLVPPRAVAAL